MHPQTRLHLLAVFCYQASIHFIGLVAYQTGPGIRFGAQRVDHADSIARLVQPLRHLVPILPGRFQTGVDSLRLLLDQIFDDLRNSIGMIGKYLVVIVLPLPA